MAGRATPLLETARLVLEPLRLEHAAALHSIYADKRSMQFWHIEPHGEVAQTERMLREELQHAAAPSWALRLRESGALIGRVDYIAAGVTGMGYLIGSPYWRRGYGGEAVAAALDYGFRTAGYDRVELWINDANVASQRLAASLGFQRRGQFRQRYPHQREPFETQVWGLRADEWAARLAGGTFTPPGRRIAFYGVEPVLAVADVAATVGFYVEQLGCHLVFSAGEPPTFAIVGRGEWTTEQVYLHFMQGDATALPGRLYVQISDADALYAELAARGVAVEHAPVTQPYNRRELAVRDPNGLLLVFASAI